MLRPYGYIRLAQAAAPRCSSNCQPSTINCQLSTATRKIPRLSKRI
ncbi:MAG: hypothetical protein JGK29_05770 [Microcoleus sp. PH2017_17_BER_D_A]|nr:hypothetical protein [Microcoleus sp. PH2017_17_BER_D_A]